MGYFELRLFRHKYQMRIKMSNIPKRKNLTRPELVFALVSTGAGVEETEDNSRVSGVGVISVSSPKTPDAKPSGVEFSLKLTPIGETASSLEKSPGVQPLPARTLKK